MSVSEKRTKIAPNCALKMRVKTNSEMFSRRGDDWSAPVRDRTPRLSADGHLRMRREAHLYSLSHPAEMKSPPPENPDMDRYTQASRAEPLTVRLARERNQLVSPMSSKSRNSDSPPSSIRVLLINMAAKRRAKKAFRLVKG